MADWSPRVQHILLSRKARKGELALMNDVPTLGVLDAAFPAEGEEDSPAALWLKIQLSDFFDYVEAPLGVTEDRVYEMALLMIERYWYLNVAEVELWLAECKAGAKFYGVAGPSRMMELLGEYVRERNEDIDRIEKEKSARRRAVQNENAGYYLDCYREYLRGLKAKADGGDDEAKAELERNKGWETIMNDNKNKKNQK